MRVRAARVGYAHGMRNVRLACTGLTVLVACASKGDGQQPAVDGRDAGDDARVVVEHESPCDPGPVGPGGPKLGPSTRVVTIQPKSAKPASAPPKNPVDHAAMLAYLAAGLGDWTTGPGDVGGVVDDLLPGAGPSATIAGRRSLAFLAHLSDFQLTDDESPTRLMSFDTPKTGGAARPQEGGVARVVSAMHRTLAALTAKRPFDFEIVTGDCADSAQGNEHTWLVALMDGQRGLATDSGDKDDPVPGPDNDVKDPFDPVPAPAPWYFVYGNHDVEVQGTSVPDEAVLQVASASHPENGTRDYRKAWAPVTRDEVPVDAKRAPIGAPEILARMLASAASPGPVGHGFTAGQTSTHYVVDPIAGVPLRVIELDTTDPAGGADGQVLRATVDSFLEPALIQSENEGRLAIVASHQCTTDLHVTQGLSTTPAPGALTGAEVESIVARHPNVVLWLCGHNHLHRVRALKGPSVDAPGYYEVQTGAIADWPAQTRAIELVSVPAAAGAPASLSILLTGIDYEAQSCLEARYRSWQLVDMTTGWGQDGRGTARDRNVELRRAVPKGVALAGVGKVAIETETTLVGKVSP